MAIIGENILILKEDSSGHFDWVGKCPCCGTTELATHQNSWVPVSSSSKLATIVCRKCGQRYEVKVRR